MASGIGEMVSAAWEYAQEHSPGVFWHEGALLRALDPRQPRVSYRDILHAVKRNWRGRALTRREVVEYHLRLFSPTRLDPNRLR